MTTVTISARGQITIPVSVRQALNVGAGDQVEFVQTGPRRFEVIAATRSVRELKGMFGKPLRRVPIQEMSYSTGCVVRMTSSVCTPEAAGRPKQR